MHVCCLVVLIKEKKAIDFHNNIGIHKFIESALRLSWRNIQNILDPPRHIIIAEP